ncbi:MAG: carboxypeptidase regulatory-like domain-containing protein [Pyrinomonadaceae bacterium]
MNKHSHTNPIFFVVFLVLFAQLALSQSSQQGKIAFSSDRDGQSEIYVMNTDGSAQERLTATQDDEYLPAWSPDGGTLAFLRRGSDGNCSIFLMDVSGLNVRSVPNSAATCTSSISWAPDGSRIAFSNFPNLFSMRIDGTGKFLLYTTYTNPFFQAIDPSWSPDGSKIAFTGPGWYTDVWTVAADGTDPIRITNTPFTYTAVGSPSWSGLDGRIIYADASEDMGSNHRIASVRPDGSEGQIMLQLSSDLILRRPSLSPDGQKFVFAECTYQFTSPHCHTQIAVSGTGTITSLGGNSDPSWQPAVAKVSISGRVTTAGGRGIGNVRVTIEAPSGTVWVATTSAFGYFLFEDVSVGTDYSLTARSRRYTFLPQQISPAANVTGIGFVAVN